jgi:A/G-specific adenine glycosylase
MREKAVHAHDGAQESDARRTSSARRVSDALVAWYRSARRDLPWRRTRDAYAIWISEVMLQQTRVETVIPYYARFLSALPTVHALAEAPLDRVLELWSGLGYYRRARLLHRGAQDVARDHRGVLPHDAKTLAGIAGIGRYTAGAIASIAFGERAPVVDGNVARVISRLDAREEDPASPNGKRALWSRAEALAACDHPGDLNQALMELGATICTPKNPKCAACPISNSCIAREKKIAHELPRVARRKKPKTVEMRAFVIQTREGIVMGKRTRDGLYAGLWEPPMRVSDEKNRVPFGLKNSAFQSRGVVEHVLTHRRLVIDVLCMRSENALKLRAFEGYESVRVVRRSELATLAMSTLARRVIARGVDGQDLDLRSL